jgi:hypothetical protein
MKRAMMRSEPRPRLVAVMLVPYQRSLTSPRALSGSRVLASATGAQLGAVAFGATTVTFVIGAQKVVSDLDEGFRRVEEYCLPLEDALSSQTRSVGRLKSIRYQRAKAPCVQRVARAHAHEGTGLAAESYRQLAREPPRGGPTSRCRPAEEENAAAAGGRVIEQPISHLNLAFVGPEHDLHAIGRIYRLFRLLPSGLQDDLAHDVMAGLSRECLAGLS